MTHPRVFVVSGPSGVGKSSIIKAVLRERPDVKLSVSMTTRPPREGEVEGRDYFFVDQKAFEEQIESGGFLEWARNYDQSYGTGHGHIADLLDAGHHALLDVDTQGAMQIKGAYDGAVYVFIRPVSVAVLEARLRGRGSETEESLQKRLARAEQEINQSGEYDHVIVNNLLEEAIAHMLTIVDAATEEPVDFRRKAGPADPEISAISDALEDSVRMSVQQHLTANLRTDLVDLVNQRLGIVVRRELPLAVAEALRKHRTGG